MKMKTAKFLAAAVLAAGLALIGGPAGAQDNAPFTVSATGTSAQGFFKVITEAFHGIYREAYPGTSASFHPASVAGGTVRVAKGEMDLSMGMPPVEVVAAIRGTEPFQEPMKGKIFHVMRVLETLDFYFLLDKRWADDAGVASFADLVAKKPKVNLAVSQRGTFYALVAAEEMFKQYGVALTDVNKWGGSLVFAASGQGLDDLRDGKVNGIILAGFQPDARIADINKSRPLIWIKADKDKLAKVAEETGMAVATLPKSHYEFLDGPVDTLRASTTIAAGAHVPEATVYKIVKSIADNVEKVRAVHPSLRDFSVEIMARKNAVIDYHPGAAKYYREKGLIK